MIAIENLQINEPIYEFGSFQVQGQINFADLRPLFPGKKYVGCDIRKGPGVDRVLDLHKLDLPDNSVGTVLTMDTMEHVEYPRKALSEILRVLKPGGIVIMSSVMCFEIHEYPYDYWRFTPKAFESLFKEFQDNYVTYAGKRSFPHTIVGIGRKNDQIKNKVIIDSACDKWRNIWKLKILKNKLGGLLKRINA